MFYLNRVYKTFTNLQNRPAVLFLPFLVLYSVIVIVFSKSEMIIDKPSYLGFAHNLLQGFYSPPPPEIDLWHAPGYPILLTPFVALGVPLLVIRLLNAVFLYLSIILLYRLLQKLVPQKWALYTAFLTGFYWLAWKSLPVIMTESFVFFLITAIATAAHACFREQTLFTRRLLLLSFLLGYLALTRFMFGYVLATALFVCAVIWIWRKNVLFKKAALVLALALVFTTPYLAYTHHLTGRFFYWGNTGGFSVYWMSNPVEGEWGDWFNDALDPNESVDGYYPDAKEKLEANHRADIEAANRHTGVARDDAYKRMGWENIRNHPLKFCKNWLANVGRLLFNYLHSYRRQGIGSYLNMVPNMFLVVAMVLLLFPTIAIRKQIPFFIKFLLLVAAIYFAGSSLLSATIRMFYILLPILAIWLCYVASCTIHIHIQPKKE